MIQNWLRAEKALGEAMLAWEFYKIDASEIPPKPKGRREAIEHTRNLNEAGD